MPAEAQDTSHNVVLTLDLAYQKITADAMGEECGAAVVMEAATGDILAMVSTPDFDPSAGQTEATGDAYVNKALFGYPPASVFKIILVAAALESGITPSDFVCEGKYQLENGHIVNCWKESGHGEEIWQRLWPIPAIPISPIWDFFWAAMPSWPTPRNSVWKTLCF